VLDQTLSHVTTTTYKYICDIYYGNDSWHNSTSVNFMSRHYVYSHITTVTTGFTTPALTPLKTRCKQTQAHI